MNSRSALIITNSPIEFVLLGPFYGRDRVLIKSENAGPDLIGQALIESATEEESSSIYSRISNPFKKPKTHIVKSMQAYDVGTISNRKDNLFFKEDRDSRTSSFIYAWRGHTTKRSLKEIEKVFQLYLYDIIEGISDNDNAGAEQNIAPLIYLCHKANESEKKSKKSMSIFMVFYIFMLTILSLSYFFKI